MEKSNIVSRVAYDTCFKNINFCESLLHNLDQMTYRDIPIRHNLSNEFISEIYSNKDRSIIFSLSDEEHPNFNLHLVNYQNYKSYIATINIASDLRQPYTDISFEDIYQTLKIYEEISKKEEYSLEESYDKIQEFLKDSGMKGNILSSLYEIAENNGSTYCMYKYITDDLSKVFLLIFDVWNEGLDIYVFDHTVMRFVRYFDKAINYSGYANMSDFLDRIEDTDK